MKDSGRDNQYPITRLIVWIVTLHQPPLVQPDQNYSPTVSGKGAAPQTSPSKGNLAPFVLCSSPRCRSNARMLDALVFVCVQGLGGTIYFTNFQIQKLNNFISYLPAQFMLVVQMNLRTEFDVSRNYKKKKTNVFQNCTKVDK